MLYHGPRGNNLWRNEAVKHHAAEYYLDSNHDRQWRWLDEKKEEK